jgi:hypothetical protein
MPDLHGWLSQQIDAVEAVARAAASDGTPDWYTKNHFAVADGDGDAVAYNEGNPTPDQARHIALHDPAGVLRRCAADRKILAEHRPHGGKWEPYACEGCGMDGGDCADWMVEHVNDCPTLLALAEGYGLTGEQRAVLDRPEPERPAPSGPSLLPDGLAEAMFGNLYAFALGVREVERSPEVKAMEILNPELKKIPGYLPTTEEQQ